MSLKSYYLWIQKKWLKDHDFQDHYKVLGLSKLRYMATMEEIRYCCKFFSVKPEEFRLMALKFKIHLENYWNIHHTKMKSPRSRQSAETPPGQEETPRHSCRIRRVLHLHHQGWLFEFDSNIYIFHFSNIISSNPNRNTLFPWKT